MCPFGLRQVGGGLFYPPQGGLGPALQGLEQHIACETLTDNHIRRADRHLRPFHVTQKALHLRQKRCGGLGEGVPLPFLCAVGQQGKGGIGHPQGLQISPTHPGKIRQFFRPAVHVCSAVCHTKRAAVPLVQLAQQRGSGPRNAPQPQQATGEQRPGGTAADQSLRPAFFAEGKRPGQRRLRLFRQYPQGVIRIFHRLRGMDEGNVFHLRLPQSRI